MTHFKRNAHVLILVLLLSYPPIATSQEVIKPVTYRAKFIPFGKGLTRKKTIPPGGGALGLDFELVFSPGTVTAEVTGEINFYEGNQTLQVRGTGGHLSSEGGMMLKGDAVIDFMVPLPEAFFEEDDSVHINHRIPIPGLGINKGWNESEAFNSFLLIGSHPESVKLDIGIPDLVTIRLSAIEIVPVVTSAILSGGTLTTAVKIFADNLSDYLDAGISLNGGVASELTLSGRSVTVNGTPITNENGLFRAPNLDPTKGTYHIQSNYDEDFTYALDFVASGNAYAKVTILGGIEIWSYSHLLEQARVPIIDENTFNLNFEGAATSTTVRVPTKPPSKELIPGLIPDPDLAFSVRRSLAEIQDDAPITRDDMSRLTSLRSFGSIRYLTGLEYAINIDRLRLNNNISDVSPLSGLTNLTGLDLSNNRISDVSPLSGLTDLTFLNLGYNRISDASPLSGLPNLRVLHLNHNAISKLSLSGLTNLIHLSLSNNPLSEVSLSNLPKLTVLGLSRHALSEVSLSNLPKLTDLNLNQSAISKLSLSGLTNLTGLRFRSHNPLSEVSLSNLPKLTDLSLSRNTIFKLSLSGLTNLMRLDLKNNPLSEVSLSNLPKLTDLRLRANAISKLSLSGLTNLTWLDLSNNKISDISGLSVLTDLTFLDLPSNRISDVSALSGLTNLTRLDLSNNRISDVSALSRLTNLTRLDLSNNPLSEVSLSGFSNLTDLSLSRSAISKLSLSGLTNLTSLHLSNNILSEASLSDLPNLTRLGLSRNNISKLSLSGLTNLTSLHLSNNRISDVSTLSGLTNLTRLDLPSNRISDVSTLSGLTNLTRLDLLNNRISDVSALSGLTNLTSLGLLNNRISDVSALSSLTNLTNLDLSNNPLNYASLRVHIPAMQARGVQVWFNDRTTPILVKISGEGQIGTSGSALPTPFVVQALDVEDKPMSGVSIRFAVYQGRGTLSTTTTTTDTTGKAQTTLTLGPDMGANKVAVIAEGFEETVSFSATARVSEDVNGDGVINIQDLVLVSSNLGEVGENEADVNGDGTVNIQDLVQVSTALQ